MKWCEAVFLIILLEIAVYSGMQVFKGLQEKMNADENTKKIDLIVTDNEEAKETGFNKQSFLDLKEQNKDLVAYLEFDSGIVKVPIVQSYDNDYYLRRDYFGKWSTQGTCFMDYQNTLNDTNMTIYGHNVYYDETAMFSPLSKLVDQEWYDKNNTFKLYLEDEIREYEVVNVYYYPIDSEYVYTQPEFSDSEDFDDWYRFAKDGNLILPKTGAISYPNRFVTLQTCKKWDDNTRIIILGKEVKYHGYE